MKSIAHLSSDSHSHSGHNNLGPEGDKSPTLLLGILLVCLTVLMLAIVFGSRQLLWITASLQHENVHASVDNPELIELKAKWNEELTTYKKLSDEGVYQVPVEMAMMEVVRQYKK
jgi:hypothetical protein